MTDLKIIHGDCRTELAKLADASINCCVTSPPYYGLRNYNCDGQIGLEKTPDEYVAELVAIFRDVRRTLRDDGTLWVNIGDSYYNYRPGKGQALVKQSVSKTDQDLPTECARRGNRFDGIKEKDLIGIPWMLAFALRADGWYLRSEIIWHKPNPMPESVEDRPTKAHEQIFLLSKSQSYYYDGDAIAEPLQESSVKRNQTGWAGNEHRGYVNGPQNHMSKYLGSDDAKAATHRNRRSVWTVATKPYNEAHFATFPPALIKPCILAGCPAGGVVLDPFGGSGTTGKVALELGRSAVLIELNPDYLKLIEKRSKVNLPLFV